LAGYHTPERLELVSDAISTLRGDTSNPQPN
jgi:hypothetical protein